MNICLVLARHKEQMEAAQCVDSHGVKCGTGGVVGVVVEEVVVVVVVVEVVVVLVVVEDKEEEEERQRQQCVLVPRTALSRTAE